MEKVVFNNAGNMLEKIKPQLELYAALLSGALIVIAWLAGKWNHESLSVSLFIAAFIIGGYAKAKEGINGLIQNKRLNVEVLMICAAIGSGLIGYWAEGAILIFIFSLSGALETYTMNKSRKEISGLMEVQPENALRIKDGKEQFVRVDELEIGDEILVKPGERIAADGIISKGRTTIDESAITGEPVPVEKNSGDEIFAGTVNISGSITAEVKKKSNETLFQQIIHLVQSAQSEKPPSQLFIERFEGTYVKVVFLTVILMMFLPHYLFGWSWTETVYRAMILLVVASPCALVASIMPATLSAISNGARHGTLFKGGVHLESLARIKVVAMDKTGTLTKGKPEVTNFMARDTDETDNVLVKIASIENESTHPLAQAIVRYAVENKHLKLFSPDSLENVTGWGVKSTIDGEEWLVGKPAFVGKDEASQFCGGIYKQWAAEGKTVVFAKDSKGIAAAIALKDVIRPETKTAVKELKEMGIKTVMLTGDSENTARAIAKESGVDEYVAECLPGIKVEQLKRLKAQYGPTAMVGDGINDAPALATADVGIAMGEGSDIALETADIVLMKNELNRITEAIRLSKRMNRIVKQNIIFSIAVICLLIASNFFAFIDLPLGVIGHEGSTILVILNGLRLLKS